MIKIKICGLRQKDDAEAVNKYLPDYVGFVFAGEKRKINDTEAGKLKNVLDKQITVAGVFVNEPKEHIVRLCEAGIINMVQLHGDETPAYIHDLRDQIKNPIIKAVRIRNAEQIVKAADLPVDYLLFDAYVKDAYGGTAYGGSGKTFDLGILEEAFEQIENGMLPYFLAGGIHAENLPEILSRCKRIKYPPYCIDVSSGTETKGKKDEVKIKEIIRQVKEY